jgi:glutathione S-transferase
VAKAYEPRGGPYFLGERASLADIMVYPWIARLGVLQHYRGFIVPEEPQYAAFHRFVAAFSARPSAAAVQSPLEVYVKAYDSYANPPAKK